MSDETSPAQPRQYWIDIMRTFACLCVIITHAPIPGAEEGQTLVKIVNYYTMAGASVIFFMISGALIFYRPQQLVPFMKKRLLRIGVPVVVWSLITILYVLFKFHYSPIGLLAEIVMIPFNQANDTYWFIYVLMGIYLLTPMLSTWLNSCSRRDCEILLAIWFFTLCLPYFSPIYPRLGLIVNETGIFHYFAGYVGYAVLGFYLRRYLSITRFTPAVYIVIAVAICLPWLLYSLTSLSSDIISTRLVLNTALLSSIIFLLIKRISVSERIGRLFYTFANHSFGIYLSHVLIMRSLIWPVIAPMHLHYAVQIPLVTLLTLILSYALVDLLSRMPFSRYTVSFTSDRPIAPIRSIRTLFSLR